MEYYLPFLALFPLFPAKQIYWQKNLNLEAPGLKQNPCNTKKANHKNDQCFVLLKIYNIYNIFVPYINQCHIFFFFQVRNGTQEKVSILHTHSTSNIDVRRCCMTSQNRVVVSLKKCDT